MSDFINLVIIVYFHKLNFDYTTESAIISKIWNKANVLRDDSVSYGDYLEQITYLLLLKMADEMKKPKKALRNEGLSSWKKNINLYLCSNKFAI